MTDERQRQRREEQATSGQNRRDERLALLGDWRLVWALTVIFVLVEVEAVLTARYLHDEGVLTWYFAQILGDAPIAGLFFQKLRPVLALVYAPVAPFGFKAFAFAHVLIAASAIPLSAAIAERLGQRLFAIPAVVVASSPLFVIGAAAGHSNCDALVGILVGVYLIVVRERSLAGGAVLGAMLLVRSEVAPIIAAIALGRLLEDGAGKRDLRVLIGTTLVPLAFALLGSLYHRDLLWVLHYPPTLMSPVPGVNWVDDRPLIERLDQARDALLCLSPAIGLLVLLRPRALRGDERGLALGLVLFLLAIRGFPLTGLFNFDESPRYLLVGLPALALVLGRQADDALDGRDSGWIGLALLAAMAGFGWLTLARGAMDLMLPVVAIWALVLGLSRLGKPALAIGLWLGATVLSFPLWPARSWLLPATERIGAIEDWWRGHAEELGPDDAVLTNVALTQAWLSHRGLVDGQQFHFLLQRDMAYEIDQLLNHEVGQDEAIYAAMNEHFYGRPVREQLDPLDWPEHTMVIFDDDERLAVTVDLERWKTYAQLHREPGGVLVGWVVHEPPNQPRKTHEPPAAEGDEAAGETGEADATGETGEADATGETGAETGDEGGRGDG